jgi:hypothetical protein
MLHLRLIFSAFLIALITTSCAGPRYCDFFPYYDDGRCKPIVAIVPVIDSTDADYCWDMGEELTDLVYESAMEENNLFVLPLDRVESISSRYSREELNGINLDFALRFGNAEFVILMELIEHHYCPYEKGKITPIYPLHNRQCDSVLCMKVRLRVIDVRYEKPVLVLQEIFKSNHMIPRAEDEIDYTISSWGTPTYKRTPVAIAHQKMASDLLNRSTQMIQSVR